MRCSKNKRVSRGICLTVVALCFIALLFSIPVRAAGTYICELSGEPVDESIRSYRPIAVMIDNEEKALPHSSAAKADIVYEMMNSTLNGRITRLMCIYKNYQDIEQIGSVRSVRTTHIPIAAEYDAILIHEGGPELYIKPLIDVPWALDIDGGFSRLKNGKSQEFTEFVLKGEVEERARSLNISLKYDNEDFSQKNAHFVFGENDLGDSKYAVKTIDMSTAYPHTSSKLIYNPNTNTYDYYAYDSLQADDTGETITFDNVIIQVATLKELDENGYMLYKILGTGTGIYCTNGRAVRIIWKKDHLTSVTKYYEAETGKRLVINPGKTYINIYPKEYLRDLKLSDK